MFDNFDKISYTMDDLVNALENCCNHPVVVACDPTDIKHHLVEYLLEAIKNIFRFGNGSHEDWQIIKSAEQDFQSVGHFVFSDIVVTE